MAESTLDDPVDMHHRIVFSSLHSAGSSLHAYGHTVRVEYILNPSLSSDSVPRRLR